MSKNNNTTLEQTELDMGIQCYINGKPVSPEEFTKSYGIDDEPPEAWDAAWKASYKKKAVDNTVESLKLAEDLGTYDVVSKPKHYNSGEIECIDAMQSMLSPEEFIGYLRGNSFKYRWRYPDKNGMEDILKAQWYETKLVKVLGSHGQ